MSSIDLANYKNIYIQTAKEYIDSLSISCVKLTDNPQNKDAINNLHISSHSLKSQSQVMGFTEIASTCLNIEKMSNDALKETIRLNDENISEIRKAVEKLDKILKSIRQAQDRRIQDDTGK